MYFEQNFHEKVYLKKYFEVGCLYLSSHVQWCLEKHSCKPYRIFFFRPAYRCLLPRDYCPAKGYVLFLKRRGKLYNYVLIVHTALMSLLALLIYGMKPRVLDKNMYGEFLVPNIRKSKNERKVTGHT